MAYDIKFKKRVLEYLAEGHSQEATAKVFGIGTTTIKAWKKENATTGLHAPKPRNRKPRKIDPEKLREAVAANPDAYLSELAEQFGCSIEGIRKVLKKLKITRKKRR
jgi:transposase